jgi:transposase-like protein
MGNCDLCNTDVGADATPFSADQMRQAVRAGLRPRGPASELAATLGLQDNAQAGWVDMVMRDTTNWALCAECATAARALL